MPGKNPWWEIHFLCHSTLKHAHSFKQVSSQPSYNCSFTTNYAGIPSPPALPMGVSRRVQALWSVDIGQSQQWTCTDTLMCGCWTVPAIGLAPLPGPFLQSHGAHGEAFPSDRAWMSALEKYLSPNYLEHATKLQLFRAWSLSTGRQCNFTTGCSWSRSWTLWLLKAECLDVLEKDSNLDLEVLIWDQLQFSVILPYRMLWALRWLVSNKTSCLHK